MRGRNIPCSATFQRVSQTLDEIGGVIETVTPFVIPVNVVRRSESRNVEGYQEGENLRFNCTMILNSTFYPTTQDTMVFQEKTYSLSEVYTDDKERIKQVKFIATIRDR